MRNIDVLFICFHSENIVAIGTDDDIAREFKGVKVDKTIDASGCCILPGKIECKSIIRICFLRFC
jgi:dihydroorotase-like cyclic amidohydrolase